MGKRKLLLLMALWLIPGSVFANVSGPFGGENATGKTFSLGSSGISVSLPNTGWIVIMQEEEELTAANEVDGALVFAIHSREKPKRDSDYAQGLQELLGGDAKVSGIGSFRAKRGKLPVVVVYGKGTDDEGISVAIRMVVVHHAGGTLLVIGMAEKNPRFLRKNVDSIVNSATFPGDHSQRTTNRAPKQPKKSSHPSDLLVVVHFCRGARQQASSLP